MNGKTLEVDLRQSQAGANEETSRLVLALLVVLVVIVIAALVIRLVPEAKVQGKTRS